MERIERATPDITQENIERLAGLFPSVATEIVDADGNPQAAIDFDALRELLGDVAEGQCERYQFTWPGKCEAKLLARTPCDKTMRPERSKSVNWDETENLYIEGDNLEALKLMRETYAGKIKLIYIDPPYNTGHDFIYDDDFAQTRGEYEATSGDFDEEGGRLVECCVIRFDKLTDEIQVFVDHDYTVVVLVSNIDIVFFICEDIRRIVEAGGLRSGDF